MQNPFKPWIGQTVVVQIACGPDKVSLRGMLLRDQSETLLMRLEAGPDLEIAKTKVLAIEEYPQSQWHALLMSFIENAVDQGTHPMSKTRT
jgi:hypothetical protein